MDMQLDRASACGVIYISLEVHTWPQEATMAQPGSGADPRGDALRREGTLNTSAERVRDPKFQEGEFFDPRDIVQVRYEMLRRVRVENASVTEVSGEYGVSRPTYYQAMANFEEAGIAGLVPGKRGPRGPHKLRDEVMAFLERQVVPGQPVRARDLAALVLRTFALDVHPRTIERALRRKGGAW
jgi:transposase